MKTSKEDIGARIKELRSRSGMLQKDLGARIGVGKQAISHYESGTAYPSPDALAMIAEIGNVTTDWLITGKETVMAPVVSKEEALLEVMRAVITRDNPLLDQIREAGSVWLNGHNTEEQLLLILFRKLGQAEREKVIEIARLYAGERDG